MHFIDRIGRELYNTNSGSRHTAGEKGVSFPLLCKTGRDYICGKKLKRQFR